MVMCYKFLLVYNTDRLGNLTTSWPVIDDETHTDRDEGEEITAHGHGVPEIH